MTQPRARFLTALLGMALVGAPAAHAQRCPYTGMAQVMVNYNYSRAWTPTYNSTPAYSTPNYYQPPSRPTYTPPSTGTYGSYRPTSYNFNLNLYTPQAQTRYTDKLSQGSVAYRGTEYHSHTTAYASHGQYSSPSLYHRPGGFGYCPPPEYRAPGHYYSESSLRYRTDTSLRTTSYHTPHWYSEKGSETTLRWNKTSLLLGLNGGKRAQYQNPKSGYERPSVAYRKPASEPIPLKIAAVQPGARDRLGVTISVKFSGSCGQCHFPKSQPGLPQSPPQLVRTVPLPPIPIVARPPQSPPPFPLTSPPALLIPSVLPVPTVPSSPPVTIESAPPRPSLPTSVAPVLLARMTDEPPRSRIAEILAAPELPGTVKNDLLPPLTSRSAQIAIAAAPARAKGRLLPDAVLAMPPLPSGSPVLPQPVDDEASPHAVSSLVEVVMQAPPIPVERD